jgi:hypothetical protein
MTPDELQQAHEAYLDAQIPENYLEACAFLKVTPAEKPVLRWLVGTEQLAPGDLPFVRDGELLVARAATREIESIGIL